MKKFGFLMILIISILLVGCDFLTKTTTTISLSTNANTTTSQVLTTSSTVVTNPTTTVTTLPTTTVTTTTATTVSLILNPGQDTVEINTDWSDAGAKGIVNQVEHVLTTASSVDVTTTGIYPIEYVFEYNQVFYYIVRYVIVSDQIAPILQLNPGIDTVMKDSVWTDAGAQVHDNSNATLTINVLGEVNTTIAGTYQIIYTAQDASGNESQIIRFVTVRE